MMPTLHITLDLTTAHICKDILLKNVLAAEDFSFLADAVPGAFMFLGIQNEAGGSTHGLHTPQFQLDEAVMPLGAAMHASIALDALSQQDMPTQGKAHSEL